jgi:hypothetical protein
MSGWIVLFVLSLALHIPGLSGVCWDFRLLLCSLYKQFWAAGNGIFSPSIFQRRRLLYCGFYTNLVAISLVRPAALLHPTLNL